ncbi:major facilitator superfamily domain-containing protein [Gamsiella multidivaricata]|uniref:major facilitator superfamily domain-containing protein n=1 Tax=Gamsiella multidivaricata TaxID=101098 RepID=UPI00221F4830|nr:major facilitator superfamily domain-containing protein [Gamsiella multidivaricata]KAG0371368.1 hypothetical protein BGZ54_005492 [Gamsiella multidivaricata]KAI7832819.1 major facilitator superfamily domain-containing protein [Gamsiella multidivaricata]
MASPSDRPKGRKLPHHPSEATITNLENENTPLLPKKTSDKQVIDPTALYVKVLDEHLPWHKRPSVLWLLPIFGLAWIGSGMLASSIGQLQAALLCREYLNRHTSNTTLLASEGVVSFLSRVSSSTGGLAEHVAVAMRPAAECQIPEIQAYTAKITGLIEVLTGIASTFSIGYYSSLSDKHGRRTIMFVCFVNSFLTLAAILAMSLYWDQIGLPLMVASGLLVGLLGGTSLSLTITLAYTADCTDPAKRSLAFSWLHASLFLGLSVGSYLGGTIVRATNTILSIVYLEMITTTICFLLVLFFVPESLPGKQPEKVQRLYETFKKKNGTGTTSQERVAWHSHAIRALSFFKPNGRNTNLVLLAAISFLQMLAMRGTLSVIILYTNKMFDWTEYEDGIMFMLSSLVRLFTMLLLLPILVQLHQRAYQRKQNKVAKEALRHGKQPDVQSQYLQTRDPIIDSVYMSSQVPFNENDPSAAASVQHLGGTALELSLEEHERRNRQISVDSIGTLAPSNGVTSHPQNAIEAGEEDENSSADAYIAPVRTQAQTFSDMKFDTWMIRLGSAISSITYVGYGLAREGWVFYLATALHAVYIISSPSLKSLLTNLVEPSQFGAVLGAVQVVDSIAVIFSPIVISWVYALTVGTMPEFVWYSCAAWAGICVVLAFMIRQKQFRNNMDF